MVTGNAGRLFAELWSDVEHSRDASGHGDSRIGDTAFRGRRDLLAPRTVASSRAVLFQYLDLRSVALVDRPIERRFTFRRPGVRVGAVVEQQLHRIRPIRFRGDGCQQRSSIVLSRNAGVHVCTELDQTANRRRRLPGDRRRQ